MLAPHAHMSWSQPKCFPHSFVFPTILGNFYNLVKDKEVRIGRRSLADLLGEGGKGQTPRDRTMEGEQPAQAGSFLCSEP